MHNSALYKFMDSSGCLRKNCDYILDYNLNIEPAYSEEDVWKKKLIIGCTVAVAFEIVIVFIIFHFWKQLKVTFSKFTCPCVSEST